MAEVQTQVSLRNNGNYSESITQAYDIITNGTISNNIVSRGDNGMANNSTNTVISNAQTPYGLLYVNPFPYAYGTNGNFLYRYNLTTATPVYEATIDVTASTTTGTILPYTNNATITQIPGTVTQTNNYNTTSFPITVASTGTTITATSSTSYTVTSVFGTNAYLDTDGIKLYILLPDSRILSIPLTGGTAGVITQSTTVSIVRAEPALSNLTTDRAYGLACTPRSASSYLYVFDGYDNNLYQINPNIATPSSTILVGTGLPAEYSGYVFYPQGSIVTAYTSPYNNVDYLFVAAYNGPSYYAIDALQLTKNVTPPKVAFKYSTVSMFNQEIINMSQYGGILFTLSKDPFPSVLYKNYQLTINISGAPICFLKGTYIYTNKGYELIETLKKGDLVNTFKDNYVAIDTIVEEEIIHDARQERNKCQLYKLDYPEYPQLLKELYITGAHSILVGKLTEKQKARIIQDYGKVFATDLFDRLPAYIDERAKVHDESGKYTIYHLALENQNNFTNYGIFANGLLVESLSKNDCVNRLF